MSFVVVICWLGMHVVCWKLCCDPSGIARVENIQVVVNLAVVKRRERGVWAESFCNQGHGLNKSLARPVLLLVLLLSSILNLAASNGILGLRIRQLGQLGTGVLVVESCNVFIDLRNHRLAQPGRCINEPRPNGLELANGLVADHVHPVLVVVSGKLHLLVVVLVLGLVDARKEVAALALFEMV